MSYNYQYHSDSDSDRDIETSNETSDSEPELLTEILNKFRLNNNQKMATPKLEKCYLDMIPDFHGDSKLLARFIEISEKLVKKFYNVADTTDF